VWEDEEIISFDFGISFVGRVRVQRSRESHIHVFGVCYHDVYYFVDPIALEYVKTREGREGVVVAVTDSCLEDHSLARSRHDKRIKC